MNIKKALRIGKVIDVRSYVEFSGGSVVDAINIPLPELTHRIDELKQLKSLLILCCASGNRSGMATQQLVDHGIDCINGGSWMTVNYHMSCIQEEGQ